METDTVSLKRFHFWLDAKAIHTLVVVVLAALYAHCADFESGD